DLFISRICDCDRRRRARAGECGSPFRDDQDDHPNDEPQTGDGAAEVSKTPPPSPETLRSGHEGDPPSRSATRNASARVSAREITLHRKVYCREQKAVNPSRSSLGIEKGNRTAEKRASCAGRPAAVISDN